jgi:DNA repair exonuclease SbcCD ATPase subunit
VIGFDSIPTGGTWSLRRATDDITTIVAAAYDHRDEHRKQIGELRSFLDNLRHLVHAESPDDLPNLDSFNTAFRVIFETESRCADAEERLADDLSDLVERSAGLARVSEEWKAAERQLKSAREAIERIRKDIAVDAARGGSKQARLQA